MRRKLLYQGRALEARPDWLVAGLILLDLAATVVACWYVINL